MFLNVYALNTLNILTGLKGLKENTYMRKLFRAIIQVWLGSQTTNLMESLWFAAGNKHISMIGYCKSENRSSTLVISALYEILQQFSGFVQLFNNNGIKDRMFPVVFQL